MTRLVSIGSRTSRREPLCLKCLISLPNLGLILLICTCYVLADRIKLLIWIVQLVSFQLHLLCFVTLNSGALKSEDLCLKLTFLHIAVCNQVKSHLVVLSSFLELILAVSRRFLLPCGHKFLTVLVELKLALRVLSNRQTGMATRWRNRASGLRLAPQHYLISLMVRRRRAHWLMRRVLSSK